MPEWMTVDEAAAYLKVTRRTLYRWCDEGRLPFYELESGGGRRFKRVDLDALLRPGRPVAIDVELADLYRRMQAQMRALGAYSDAFAALAELVSKAAMMPAPPGFDRTLSEAERGCRDAERPLVAEAARTLRARAAGTEQSSS